MKRLIFLAPTLLLMSFMSSAVYAQGEVVISITPPPQIKILSIGQLLSATIGLALIVAALTTFLYLIWGGFQWITSGGDKAQVDAAKNKIQAAILGLFIVFASWAFMLVLEQFFGIRVLSGGGIRIPTPF
ncbi:MAG: hypothetical protein UU37_C0003G0004 [Candidatus Gottesmanbacteria bacterium GW2011_GWA2_41_12]|uniref:Uncharacterized protein n=2 Tax=Candidatus Gottesmaniibacteriota TaxID=1752720 RepID=A0A0G0WVH3_9BACT|nr:MAG: hypothetical protein UT63_C0014G0011 [Candidatus Gottesmanbacteria bacterium GW2011_GWC2_39_8]KKR88430.1 MAG: hypothetical protein UU37_C0003G0004 [Candidatus Gottesmanbacteria bacterium GW2011_GWA2_41_12]